MILSPDILTHGIDEMCDAAELDLSANFGDIEKAVYGYDAPRGIANSFRAVLDDPKAESTPPHMIHIAMQMFMNRLMMDYELRGTKRSMNKRHLVNVKFNQLLLATVFGEADIALLEAKKDEIMGKIGMPTEERFNVLHYGQRRRLYVHEDFMMPRIHDSAAKRGLSRKYIANFGYCRERATDVNEGFHESLEAAVVLCGMHHNVVKEGYELTRSVVPDEVDALIKSISHAVQIVEVEPEGTKRTAVERLHGVCTSSKTMLGTVDKDYYVAIDALQIKLRAKEKGRIIRPHELIPGRKRNQSRLY